MLIGMRAALGPNLKIYASLTDALLCGLLCGLLYGCSDTRVSLPSFAEKNTERARAESALAQNPSLENYLALGLAQAALGQHEPAIQNFSRAVAVDPKSFVARSQLCLENNILKRWADAVVHCGAVIALQPNNRVGQNAFRFAEYSLSEIGVHQGPELITRGLEFYSKGEYDEAIKIWVQISARSPQYAAARNNLASAYILKKDFVRARLMIDEALKREPKNELFQNNLGWLERESAQAP